MNADRNMQHKCIDDIVMIINSDCKFNNDFSTAYNGDSNSNLSTACENDSNSNFSLMYPINNNDSDTDDNCGAGPEKTQAFLYQHFIIIIVLNETLRKPNMVFMKVTLCHIKGEDNNSRM